MRRDAHGVAALLFFIAFQKIRMPGFYKNSHDFKALFLQQGCRHSTVHPTGKSDKYHPSASLGIFNFFLHKLNLQFHQFFVKLISGARVGERSVCLLVLYTKTQTQFAQRKMLQVGVLVQLGPSHRYGIQFMVMHSI